jgi:hypothetical protein
MSVASGCSSQFPAAPIICIKSVSLAFFLPRGVAQRRNVRADPIEPRAKARIAVSLNVYVASKEASKIKPDIMPIASAQAGLSAVLKDLLEVTRGRCNPDINVSYRQEKNSHRCDPDIKTDV